MKGIYITEQCKQEIESKIDELRNFSPLETDDDFINRGKQIIFEKILLSAIILPSEESWEDIKDMLDINTLPIKYENGVIISK